MRKKFLTMNRLERILEIFTLTILSFLFVYMQWFQKELRCIELGFRTVRPLNVFNKTSRNESFHQLQKLIISSDDLNSTHRAIKELTHSLIIKDLTNCYELDLSKANYKQFIYLLNICMKSNVKQIILDTQTSSAYFFPNGKIKSKRIIYGGFYSINSETIDIELPPTL